MSGKPTIPEITPFIEMYYRIDGNAVGGSLHIVLEDGNVASHHVALCKQFALERGDYFGAALANILLRMSTSQRWRLAHRSWGLCVDSGGAWLFQERGDYG